MSVWTAEKLGSRRTDDQFFVDINILKDGVSVDMVALAVPPGQDELWIGQQVKSRIEFLQGLDVLEGKIAMGSVSIPTDVPAPIVDAAQQAWSKDYALFIRIWPLVQAGIIASDNAGFVALKTRLQKNSKPEYVGV